MNDVMLGDLWHVQLESGEVGKMNLDTLDAAFQAGVIDEETFVLAPGGTEWVKLGAALGDESDSVRMEIPHYNTPYFASASPPPVSVGPSTLRPMVSEISEIDLGADFVAPETSGSKKWIVWTLVAAAAVAGFGFTGNSARQSMLAKKSLETALIAAAAAPPVASPAVENPTETKALEAKALPDAVQAPSLTDDQKRALIDGDKARLTKQKAKAAAPRRGSHSKGVFHKGGDPHDPLNSSL